MSLSRAFEMLETLGLPVSRRAVSGGELTRRGVAMLPLPPPGFLGVVPSPSSLRRASAVAFASPAFMDWARERADFIESDLVRAGCLPEIDPGGVRTEDRLWPDVDPRRRWLMDAVDGLGGRCEKSFGAMCRRTSWWGALGLPGTRRLDMDSRLPGGVLREPKVCVCESADVGGDMAGMFTGKGGISTIWGAGKPVTADNAAWRDMRRA